MNSDKLRKYNFSPRVAKESTKLFNKQVEEGKWPDVQNIFDHLNKDTELRKQKQAQKLLYENLINKTRATNAIESINIKSTIMVAQKFEREFTQATAYISQSAKRELQQPALQVNEIYGFRLSYREVMNILFCVGFTK